MGTGIKDNVLVHGKGFIHIDPQTVQISKGNHGSNLRIGKQRSKFFLTGQFNVFERELVS